MLIAIDYDGTYTEDKELWNLFIRDSINRGHKVVCVTMRFPHEQQNIMEDMSNIGVDVIFTSRRAKSNYIFDTTGEKPDIWIDDNPYYVYGNSV